MRCRAFPGNASAGASGVAGTAGAAGSPGGNGAVGCSAAPLGSPNVNCSGSVSSAAGTGGGSVNASGAGGAGANAGGQGGKGGWRTFNMGNGINNGQNGTPVPDRAETVVPEGLATAREVSISTTVFAMRPLLPTVSTVGPERQNLRCCRCA